MSSNGLNGDNHDVLEDAKWDEYDVSRIGRATENFAAGTGMKLNRIPNSPQIKLVKATEINGVIH